MKIILASNTDEEILVSDEDFELLKRFTWYISAHGYATTSFHSKKMSMHRFILDDKTRRPIDHIDGNKLNNQRENLRVCSLSQNAQNNTKNPLMGFRGVSFEHGSFKANIKKENIKRHLGTFKTIFEAALAYDAAALELYGPDAQTNRKIIKKIFDL